MDVETLRKNYRETLEKISRTYSRLKNPYQSEAPKLIAVSKSQPFEKVVELYQLGQRDFGENYAQELKTKAEQALAVGLTEIRWHFIGKFQSNKIGLIRSYCTHVHSVESFSHLELLQQKAPQAKLFLAVNIDAEVTKSGFLENDLRQMRAHIPMQSALNILGLMCIPNPSHDSRESFVKLRTLADNVFERRPYELSMGMSGDYTIAIEEGSRWVRVGTALFGDRIR